MLLHAGGHTIGALTWERAPTEKVAAVIRGMKSEHFDFMGKSLTLGSFFAGYGYSMIGVLILVSFALWLLSTAPDRKMTALFAVFLSFLGFCELIWFFPFAAAFSLTAALCTLLALIR
ncbi:MAG: hypothetical protein KGO82_11615, partial [Bacteroidota bacterium]|nr:hypothetical protein [Bacteroidota bacterium]